MKCRSVFVVHYGFVLTIAALGLTSGCKSTTGWKMPSMFASREPDADKLAGRLDSTPTSPATKHTPTAIASKTPSANSTTAPTTQPGGLPYGNSAMASYSATAPTGGLAAQSNGYQTGPYTTNASATRTTSAPTGTNNLQASSFQTSTPTSSGSSPGFVSPYGGTYSGVAASPTSTPNLAQSPGQLPMPGSSSATGQLPGGQIPGGQLPGGQLPGGFASNSLAPPSTFNSPSASTSPSSLPAFGNPPPLGTATNNVQASFANSSIPAYPAFQNGMNSGAGSAPSNAAMGSLPAYPALNSPLPPATASTALPSSPTGVASPAGVARPTGATGNAGTSPVASAYQSAAPTGNYAPGTTGRSTNYNFGAPPATSTTLPPNTASGEHLLRR